MLTRVRFLLFTGTMATLFIGCGDSGPDLYNLSGKVTFNGMPVVYGRIEFEPDTTKGNSGGMGYADIIDGQYDTSSVGGRGVVGGPHIVRLMGMESKPAAAPTDDLAAGEAPPPPLLFQGYSEEHDLPQEDSELEIAVPADAIKTIASPGPTRRRANDP